jgi:hypothetical protein
MDIGTLGLNVKLDGISDRCGCIGGVPSKFRLAAKGLEGCPEAVCTSCCHVFDGSKLMGTTEWEEALNSSRNSGNVKWG